MERTLPSFSRSHLLLLIVLLSLLQGILHAEALRLGVWNMFHNGSRLLPKDCDQVCALELRVKRLLGAKRESVAAAVAGVVQHNNSSQLWRKGLVVRNDFGENYLMASINGQILPLLFDTGSQFTFVQSGPSPSYFNARAPSYDTFRTPVDRVQRRHPFCEKLKRVRDVGDPDRACGFKIVQGSGDRFQFWAKGYAVREYMSLASTPQGWHSLPFYKFGVSNEGASTIDMGVSGVFGFFRGSEGISYLEQTTRRKSFSFCLPPASSPDSGFLVLEDDTNPQSTPGYSKAPMFAVVEGWLLDMTGITLDGSPVVGVPESDVGLTKIDTGSPYTKLRGQAYTLLRDEWRTAVESKLGTARYELGSLDTCYLYPNILPDIPKVGFAFKEGDTFTTNHNGNAFTFPRFNTEKQVWEQHMCWPFVQMEAGYPDTVKVILGALQMHDIRVHFDFLRAQVAWTHKACALQQ